MVVVVIVMGSYEGVVEECWHPFIIIIIMG